MTYIEEEITWNVHLICDVVFSFLWCVALFIVRLFSSCDVAVEWPILHAQAKKKKKEEAANAKLLEAEKRIKVSLYEFEK